MKVLPPLLTTLALVTTTAICGVATAAEQEAINGCIDQLRLVGGPDARAGGRILSSDFSEAGTLVILQDAGGTKWRCIGYNDGTVGELQVLEASDDGGGAMAGSASEGTTSTEQVHFAKGTSSAAIDGGLTPGSSMRYVLGARKNQFLDVRVEPQGDGITYQIFNPDNSFLLDAVDADTPYRGQLWQNGNHVVEVINMGNTDTAYTVYVSIE